jgi:hypothetical protein
MTKDELLLKNYQGKVFRYRNPGSPGRREKIATLVSGVVPSLLADTDLPVKVEEEADADRIIV